MVMRAWGEKTAARTRDFVSAQRLPTALEIAAAVPNLYRVSVLDRVTKDLGRHPQMAPRFEAFNQLLEDDYRIFWNS